MPLVEDAPWEQMTSDVFEELAREFGTPYFIYDIDHIVARVKAVQEAFAGLVKVYFAVKANPNLQLLRVLRSFTDGLDISSGGELAQALVAGYDPRALSFAGPAKTPAELREAVLQSVGCISVESIRELRECIQVARQVGRKASIALRVNPSMLNRAFGMKMGGKAIQFGIDEEMLDDALSTVVAHAEELDFQGVHVYAGSQCFDAVGVVDGVRHTLAIVRRVEANFALRCKSINLGGGFGVFACGPEPRTGSRGVVSHAEARDSGLSRRHRSNAGSYSNSDAIWSQIQGST
ncbi:MAG: alanine racemase [Betaproteobacteria bacterium]|nr:alanine racemase [Betaproteobacteria bacterium]